MTIFHQSCFFAHSLSLKVHTYVKISNVLYKHWVLHTCYKDLHGIKVTHLKAWSTHSNVE